MRICFLADGSLIHTHRWIQYFAEKGYQIHLISTNEIRFGPLDNVTIHRIIPVFQKRMQIISYFLDTFTSIFKARKLIRIIKPDIVHAHFLTDYGLMGYFVHFPLFVVTVWGSDILITPNKSLFFRIMAKLVLNSAKLITCDSDIARKECLKYCKHPENVEIIQWGVDLSLFREKRRDHTKCINITVLSTRSASPLYNIDSIIRSIPYVIEKYQNVRYIIKFAVSNQESELQQLACSLNVTKYIEFVNKMIDYNEFPELLYSADMFVSVPSSDSSSVSLHEAMACGLAAIVSDIPANHEWITDGWNGFIVPVRNPEKLASSIIQLIENPELMQLFGERNAQIIRDRADREKHMSRMENLYKQLLEKGK